jgi:hypothetical protein
MNTATSDAWRRPWPTWLPVAGSPDLAAAQAKTSRQFPVFLLTRQG